MKKSTIRWLLAAVLVFSISFGWVFFWTWGQPFFDEDYGRWLEPARTISFSDVAKMVTPFPQDWGFLDKPVELLFFKTLYAAFGLQPVYFYIAKCMVFAAACVLVFILTAKMSKLAFPDINRRMYTAGLAALLLFTFEPTVFSTLWLADFQVLSELTVAGSLVLYLYYLERLDSDKPLSLAKKILLQLAIVIVAVIGYKTKSTSKVIPFIIGLHAASQGKKRLVQLSPLILALVVVNIPWLALSEYPLPPILDFSKKQVVAGYYWQPANLTSFTDLFLGGKVRLWPFSVYDYVPYGLFQVLFPFGVLNLAIGLTFLYLKKRRQALPDIVKNLRSSSFLIILIWAAVNISLLCGYPLIANDLRSRHLLFILIPVCVSIAFLNSWVIYNKKIHGFFKIAVTLLLVLQIAAGIYQTDVRKRSSGYFMMVGNKARAFVEHSYKNANIMVLDFPDTGYLDMGTGNKYYWPGNISEASGILHQLEKKKKEIYLVAPYGPKAFNPNWSAQTEIRMETGRYYDLIGSSIPEYSLNIYKFNR